MRRGLNVLLKFSYGFIRRARPRSPHGVYESERPHGGRPPAGRLLRSVLASYAINMFTPVMVRTEIFIGTSDRPGAERVVPCMPNHPQPNPVHALHPRPNPNPPSFTLACFPFTRVRDALTLTLTLTLTLALTLTLTPTNPRPQNLFAVHPMRNAQCLTRTLTPACSQGTCTECRAWQTRARPSWSSTSSRSTHAPLSDMQSCPTFPAFGIVNPCSLCGEVWSYLIHS